MTGKTEGHLIARDIGPTVLHFNHMMAIERPPRDTRKTLVIDEALVQVMQLPHCGRRPVGRARNGDMAQLPKQHEPVGRVFHHQPKPGESGSFG
jgi:hypothetical protein